MARLLEDVMTSAYADLAENQHLEVDTNLVKTFLLEAHDAQDANHEHVFALVRDSFAPALARSRRRAQISETDEQLFFVIEAEAGDRRGPLSLFIDATNPRYWLAHSFSKTSAVDPVIKDVLLDSPKLDNAWLPVQLLERTAADGALRGLGLAFDRRKIPDVDFDMPGAPVEFLKMQLWGNRAADVLRVLREQAAFPESTTLSKVKVKQWLDGDSESFSLADVKYDGKITVRGTSFASYTAMLTRIVDLYSGKIHDLEQKFRIRGRVEDNRFYLDGAPLNIRFPHPLPDLDLFCESVFAGTAPFKLWGIPVQVSPSMFRVSVIDLHVIGSMTVEICPDFMRVYLAKGACGNTLIRLYTNLQHYYNSLISATDAQEELAFEF